MQLEISHNVRQAMDAGQPVVALETTVITHGMAFPDNLHTARAMEDAIRAEGACPATLGIVSGRPVVGIDDATLERFARAAQGTIAKCSRRDLPVILGQELDGSLTVAGTLQIAHAAGINMMATGGIGGVHRGAPHDVSADLLELARTPVTCVCAGAKSILDLPLTLEVLETHGVPVVGLGTITLPAFFAADSGLALPAYAPDVAHAANIVRAWQELAAGNGLLITVPVPAAQALEWSEAEAAITQAVRDAQEKDIFGSAVTPFLLARVGVLTGGRSVVANKALLINNARVAAQLAVHS